VVCRQAWWVLRVDEARAFPVGLEPTTVSLEGCCSIQLSYENMVGVAGFEPTTFCSQSRRATKLRYTPNARLSELSD
jgi:hypothetical protein